MKQSLIDVLFEVYSQSPEYTELVTTSKITQAEDAVLGAMGSAVENADLLTALMSCIETNSFKLGFRHAIRFMLECCGDDGSKMSFRTEPVHNFKV